MKTQLLPSSWLPSMSIRMTRYRVARNAAIASARTQRQVSRRTEFREMKRLSPLGSGLRNTFVRTTRRKLRHTAAKAIAAKGRYSWQTRAGMKRLSLPGNRLPGMSVRTTRRNYGCWPSTPWPPTAAFLPAEVITKRPLVSGNGLPSTSGKKIRRRCATWQSWRQVSEEWFSTELGNHDLS